MSIVIGFDDLLGLGQACEAMTLADLEATLDQAYDAHDRDSIERIRATLDLFRPGFERLGPSATTAEALERLIALIAEGEVGIYDHREEGADERPQHEPQYFHPGRRPRSYR